MFIKVVETMHNLITFFGTIHSPVFTLHSEFPQISALDCIKLQDPWKDLFPILQMQQGISRKLV